RRSAIRSAALRPSLPGTPETDRIACVRRIILILGALALAAAVYVAYAVWQTFPRQTGSLKVSGHSAPIRIAFDAPGIPTIHAQSIADALFGLGYVHARDRLWQIEFERRVGAGRLAEILGRGLVDSDRFLRTIGFRRAAEAAWRGLSPESRRPFEAYARGVTALPA